MRSAAKTGARSAIGRTSRGLSESRRWRDKTFWSRGLVWVCVWSYLSVLIMPSASRFIVLLPVSIQFRGHRKSPNVSPAATPGATHSYYGVDIISMTVAAIFSRLDLSCSLIRRITVTASQCLRLCLSLGRLSLSLESRVASPASHPVIRDPDITPRYHTTYGGLPERHFIRNLTKYHLCLSST